MTMSTDIIDLRILDFRPQNIPCPKNNRIPKVIGNGTTSRFRRRSLHLLPRLVLLLLPQSRHLRFPIQLPVDIMRLRHGCIPMHNKCHTQCLTFRFLGILWQVSLFPRFFQLFQGRMQVDQEEPPRTLGPQRAYMAYVLPFIDHSSISDICIPSRTFPTLRSSRHSLQARQTWNPSI
jgi:hypothetical protein